MDEVRFDDLTRALATSRRGVLKHLVGALLAGAGGLLAGGTASAQACGPLRRPCVTDDECCSGACDPATGRCACATGTAACGRDCLPLDQYQGDVDNCGGCNVRCRRAPECQLPACIDGVCGGVPDPARVGQPCGRGGEVCGADGTCTCPPDQPTACRRGCADTATEPINCGACDNRCPRTAHGTAICTGGACGIACDAGYAPCGDGCCAGDRVCCNGVCCRPGACCTESGSCSVEACAPHCEINGQIHPAGTINPDHDCLVCNPDRNRVEWSLVDDQTACGGVPGRVCCNGDCCSPAECCNPIGFCEECGPHCRIGEADVAAGEVNPADPCRVCDPERDHYGWSTAFDDTVCGGDLDSEQVCCTGACCEPGKCCTLGLCGRCGCEIDGAPYDDQAVHPDDPCLYCDPVLDQHGWSANEGAFCGPDGTQVCCAGTCCAPTECCTLDGACEPCRCEIEGVLYEAEAINGTNECQVCNPREDDSAWTSLSNTACGENGDRLCCGGLCCFEPYQCCEGDVACVPCRCRIDGEFYLLGAPNPEDPCQVCDPYRDPGAWSPALPNAPCADGSGQVCCNGVCCPSGECCHAVAGVCGPEPCQCTIGDLTVNEGTPNPDNPCEHCVPYTSTSGWTPRDDNTRCETALDTMARFCCLGVCCAEWQCCRSDDTCGPCVCTIGGEEYRSGQRNPDNDCEFCDPDQNKDGWTTSDHLSCGENGDRFCCAGTCCPAGECCHSLEGTCGAQPCRCTISDGVVSIGYSEGTINPKNRCEVCNPRQDPDGWSPRPNLENCGGAPGPASGHCCQGVCCDNASENCCRSDGTCGRCVCTIDGLEYAASVSNPANACEVCSPYDDHTGWTTLDNGSFCSATFDQVCCGGVCCGRGECCNTVSLLCEPCGCEIDGVFYVNGTANPTNDCETCDPSQSATAWSPAPDHAKCGDRQVCCNGVCCRDRTCCGPPWSTTKSCNVEWCGMTDPCDDVNPCGCTIDGVFYPHLTVNPANACQWCHAYFSTTSWFDRGDFTRCGPNGDQYCCGEVCCEVGACCNDAGVCAFDSPYCRGCVIDFRFYFHLQRNPDNPCELCNADLSTSSWSNYENQHLCGFEVVDGVSYERRCCEGVCCLGGQCCVDGECGSGPCPDL